jgi:hypothetical protein
MEEKKIEAPGSYFPDFTKGAIKNVSVHSSF